MPAILMFYSSIYITFALISLEHKDAKFLGSGLISLALLSFPKIVLTSLLSAQKVLLMCHLGIGWLSDECLSKSILTPWGNVELRTEA